MSLSDPRLFDHDPLTGVTEYFVFDEDTGGFTIETQQDVEPLVEINKALYNDTGDYRRFGGELHRIASLPNVIVMELSKQGILTPAGRILDDKRFRRWLNDPDNRLFRTRPGRV